MKISIGTLLIVDFFGRNSTELCVCVCVCVCTMFDMIVLTYIDCVGCCWTDRRHPTILGCQNYYALFVRISLRFFEPLQRISEVEIGMTSQNV
jgi:hypothetical protein